MPITSHNQLWILESDHSAYVLGRHPSGAMVQVYWGPRLPQPDDYGTTPEVYAHASFDGVGHLLPEVYPAWGGGLKYIEPCLKATFGEGVRTCEPVFVAAETRDETLAIRLRDDHYPLEIRLYFRVHAAYDLIERWVEIENFGAPVLLERALSAQWHAPKGVDVALRHLSGRWADEFKLHRQTLSPGVFVRESRRLTTSHHANPWFTLDAGAGEHSGDVWFGALAWSGNWKLLAERTDFGDTRVSLGVNDWDFDWQLGNREVFSSPVCLGGYTPEGFGGASRALHAYIRERVVPHGPVTHKVLYNSWEATSFNVDADSQIRLAERAAEMGVELFVMDDGWFHRRQDDSAGLGDWWPDTRKFPHGLAPLIERVKALGMDFGLWVEPEMVNPDSDLYRAHPDWVLHHPTRPRTEARHQLILNLARTEVQEHLIATLEKLLGENAIDFIKWDMNRNVSEPGWPQAGDRQRELWVRYVQGLYRVWGTLRERHPHVTWQSCSGGGGRADLGILRHADQVWVSDNTDPVSRLFIQHGYSQIFPAQTLEAWVTDSNADKLSLDFRFHVSMCGALGIGGNLLHWSDRDRARAAEHIRTYKAVRETIQLGQLYRLRGPDQPPYLALQYVSADQRESVVFVFRVFAPGVDAYMHGFHTVDGHPPAALALHGLDPDAEYRVPGFGPSRSGRALMTAGLTVPLANFESRMIRVTRA
jgi:alpha-galactosidase